jgi:hypothetical protein
MRPDFLSPTRVKRVDYQPDLINFFLVPSSGGSLLGSLERWLTSSAIGSIAGIGL